MEACGASHYWAHELLKLGHTAKIMASKYVAPFRTGAKNDLNDTMSICVAVTRPSTRFVKIKLTAQQAILLLHSRSHNAQKIMKVAGIDPITATAVIASIGKGEQFDKIRDFAAWLGSVPSQYSTGGKTRLGRITKKGDKYLRTLLVHGA